MERPRNETILPVIYPGTLLDRKHFDDEKRDALLAAGSTGIAAVIVAAGSIAALHFPTHSVEHTAVVLGDAASSVATTLLGGATLLMMDHARMLTPKGRELRQAKRAEPPPNTYDFNWPQNIEPGPVAVPAQDRPLDIVPPKPDAKV